MAEYLEKHNMTTFTHADLAECLQSRNGGLLQRAKYRGYIKGVGRDNRNKVTVWRVVKTGINGERPTEDKLKRVAKLLKEGKSQRAVMAEVNVGYRTIKNVEAELFA